MKQIFETYGQGVIAIIVMSVVLTLLTGIFYQDSATDTALAELVNHSIDASDDFQHTGEAFLKEKEHRLPEIIYLEDYAVFSAEYVPVENCFVARSYDGTPLTVEVTYIRNIHEESVEVHYIDGKAYFYFDLHGVYQVFVKATDQDNRSNCVMVKVPVNKGGYD